MKKNKTLALSILLISSLVGCNNKISSSSEKETSSTSVTSSSSVVKESTITSTSSSESTSSSSSSIISSSSPKEESSSSSTSSSSTSTSSSEVILEDLVDKMTLGIENKDKVKNGTLTYVEGSKESVTTYEFGVDKYGDFVHINESKGNINKYYGYNASNEVYGLQETSGEISVPIGTISESCLAGPCIQPFGYTEDDKMYGLEGAMSALKTYITEDKNKDFVNLSTASEGYKFSFGKVIQDYRTFLWINTVSFELEEDSFKKVEMTLQKYTSVVADFENDGVYYLKDNAKPTQTVTIKYEQTIGDRDAQNPHDIENYYYSSFDLIDPNNVKVEDTLTMNADTPCDLTFENVIPETSSPIVDSIKVSEETGNVKGSYSPLTNSLTLMCSVEGDYEVKVSTRKYSKTINVHVDKAIPKSLTVLFYVLSGDEYTVDLLHEDQRTINTYVNSEIYIKPSFTPSKADQNCIIEVKGDNKDKISFEKTTIINTATNVENKVYKVKATEVGTYNFTITSALDSSISMDVTYVANEIPELSSLVSNRYVRNSKGDIYVDINFEKDATNPKVGKVEVEDIYGNADDNATYKYSYNDETKKFDLVKLDENGNELSDEVMVSLEFNANYQLVYTSRVSSQVLSVFSHELMVSRIDWNAMDSDGGWSSFRFNDDGTGSFSYHKSDENYQPIVSYSCEIKYSAEEVDDEVIITIDSTSLSKIYTSKIVTSISTLVGDTTYKSFEATLTINGKVETLTFRQGG